MKYFLRLSDVMIPFFVACILVLSWKRKVDGYEAFIKGAEEGFQTVLKIMPTLIGLMVAVSVLRDSGFMEAVGDILGQITERVGLNAELVPLAFVKMFSSSAATGLLLDLFGKYGSDSEQGLTASIMMSCTETIFYTMSVYFMTANIKKTRWTLAGALLATSAGIMMSVILAKGIM